MLRYSEWGGWVGRGDTQPARGTDTDHRPTQPGHPQLTTGRSLEATRPELPLLRWYQAQPGAPPLPEGWALSMDDATRPGHLELQTNSRSQGRMTRSPPVHSSLSSHPPL